MIDFICDRSLGGLGRLSQNPPFPYYLIIQFFMHARSRKSYVYFRSIFREPNRFEIPPELGQS